MADLERVQEMPSNAICRKLGFSLLEECEFEYPLGSFMRCNDWRLDLLASGEFRAQVRPSPSLG